MNSQQLEYVRQQLIVATADLSGATKGQLVAFAENAQFTATARSRGRKKVFDKDKTPMAMCRLSVEIKSRWWVPVYLRTLTLFCVIMRSEPDYQKVGNFLVKYGISQKLKYEPVKR